MDIKDKMERRNYMRDAQRVSTSVYGVYGLTEWNALIRAGRALVRVNFTGGSASAMGVVPATYSTNNSVVKAIIEGSPDFRKGKIKRLR